MRVSEGRKETRGGENGRKASEESVDERKWTRRRGRRRKGEERQLTRRRERDGKGHERRENESEIYWREKGKKVKDRTLNRRERDRTPNEGRKREE